MKLEKKQVSVESIQDVVCEYYNLELAAIKNQLTQAGNGAGTSGYDVPGEEVYRQFFFSYREDRREA